MAILYVFHQGANNDGQLWYSSNDDINWQEDIQVQNLAMSGSPSAVAYNGNLYVFHQGSGDNGQLWYSVFDGSDWAPDTLVQNLAMSGSPSAVAWAGGITVFHQGPCGGQLWYTYSPDGANWGGDTLVQNLAMSGSPSAVAYNGNLYIFHQGSGDDGQLWYSVFDGSNWAPDTLVQNLAMSGSPSAVLWAGGISVFHQGGGDNGRLWYSYFDGTNWDEDTLVANLGMSGSPGCVTAVPAASIDYSIWSLQEPSGSGTSPTTISPSQLVAGYSDAYFHKAADGGQAFIDTKTGITTSGSTHCRTELREMTSSGAQAAWAPSGTNTMDVTGKVTLLGGGANGKVTVGQVFNSDDSIPLCELMYSASVGGFVLLYEEAKGAGTPVDLGTPVALNAPYSFQLSLTNGVLTVSINGKQAFSHTPSASILANKFYFKCGNYDQTTMAGAVTTTPYTIVENYSVNVVHMA
jgi:Alginate lyase